MTDGAKRLQRLHALRCRMADAATAEHGRLTHQVQMAEQAMQSLYAAQALALHREAAGSAWAERFAELQLITRQCEGWNARRQEWAVAKKAAASQERLAVQEREQVGCILQRRKVEMAAEESRREQARLDDLFATTRVRSAMNTVF